MNRRAFLSLTALTLAACGGGADASDDTIEIAVIPKGTTHEFWKAVHAGAERAAQELGVKAIWKGPIKEDDRSAQIQVVEDFVVRGVDGIVLMPLDFKALVAPAKEAAGAVVDDDVVVWLALSILVPRMVL